MPGRGLREPDPRRPNPLVRGYLRAKGLDNRFPVKSQGLGLINDENGPGPYATAVLRFHISFPDTYPSLPPLVTFSTDMFHPLITPLTTYMYTTDIQDNGTVSATDEERLPPGGFSLRHGFPGWFGRGSRSRQTSGQHAGTAQTPPRSTQGGSITSAATTPASSKATPRSDARSFMQTDVKEISTYDVLQYIRTVFDDEEVLDSVPLEAAGNPGAWHAWRTHRQQKGKLAGAGNATRQPGEWNWEGVWEERVKKGIAASLSEPVLFGNAGGADDIVSHAPIPSLGPEGSVNSLPLTTGSRFVS
jgi:hypothetical protein